MAEPRETLEYVQKEWLKVCRFLTVPATLAEKWWIYISSCYQSDGRHYHTLSHIYSMLSNLNNVKERLQCYEEVALAVFFHE